LRLRKIRIKYIYLLNNEKQAVRITIHASIKNKEKFG
jgi:hypothetical protein